MHRRSLREAPRLAAGRLVFFVRDRGSRCTIFVDGAASPCRLHLAPFGHVLSESVGRLARPADPWMGGGVAPPMMKAHLAVVVSRRPGRNTRGFPREATRGHPRYRR